MNASSAWRLGVATIFAGLMLSACGRFESPEQSIGKARQQIAAGDYQAAMFSLSKALSRQADNAEAQLLVAQVNFQMGNIDGAAKSLEAAESAHADAAAVGEWRTRIQLQRGQYQPVIDAFTAGQVKLADQQKAVLLAEAYLGVGRLEDAAASFASAAEHAEEPLLTEARIGLAETHAAQGNSGLAIKSLQAAASTSAKPAAISAALGGVQSASGNTAAAIEAWNSALPLAASQLSFPQRVSVLARLAEARLATGDVSGAATAQQQLAALAPQSQFVALLAARLALARGEFDSAVAQAQQLLSANQSMTSIRPVLIAALLAQGAMEQANNQAASLVDKMPGDARVARLQQAIAGLAKLPRQSVSYYLAVSALVDSLGERAAAQQVLQKASVDGPAKVTLTQALVAQEIRIGKHAEALQRAKAMHDEQPESVSATEILGYAYLANSKNAEAAVVYEQAWKSKPSSVNVAALAAARQLAGMEKPTEALENWVTQHPADAAARLQLAQILESTQPVRAIAEYQTVLKAAPGNVAALNNIALLYEAQKNPQALATARKAFELAPGVPQIMDTYGWMLVQHGNVTEGLPLLERAVRQSPGRPEVAYHYAVALAKSGQHAQMAREFLQGALASTATFPSRDSAERLMASM